MKLHRDLQALPAFKNAVVTIGSYDGVHAGHQAIIARVNATARKIGGESVLITFHPHPRHVLRPDDDSLKLLNSIDEKVELLARYGVDHVVIVPFSRDFAAQTPEAYISDFLVRHFQPKIVVIGYDHKFGNKRAGDIHLLKAVSADYGFEVQEIEQQEVDAIVVSSTKIRRALAQGQVQQAAEWLNHSFELSGRVVHGQKIGTQIGFPTANIEVQDPHKLIPPQGIYAVKVAHRGDWYEAMLYIGNRPTLNGRDRSIEVNIFDFNQDIYGQDLRIAFIAHIRDDEKFDSLDALSAQLARDKAATLRIFQSTAHS